MTGRTGKNFKAIGLTGNYDQHTKCVSKIGVTYREIQREQDESIKQIVFISINKTCINGLKQYFTNNKTMTIGLGGAWKDVLNLENKHLVSFKSIENNLLEFCFRDSSDSQETTCNKVDNNYTKLAVKPFDLDELNTEQVKYHATGLVGTFDKKTKCISKLGVDFAALCGSEVTKPC